MRKALMSLCLGLVSLQVGDAIAADRQPGAPLRVLVQIPESQAPESGDLVEIAARALGSERLIASPLISWTPRYPDRVRELGLDRYYEIVPARGWGWVDALADLPAGTVLLGVEPVGELHFDEGAGARGDEYPDDPMFPMQFGLLDPMAGIGALSAWRETYGSEEIVIAVVDSGVSATHRDLKDQLVEGYNALDGSSNTDDGNASHGTHIAGIAAASTDNGIGIAGVSRGSKIMPIKSFYSSGFGLETDVAEGIIWAADHGADVISMSFGFSSVLGPMQAAIQYAYDSGVVLVASTGNSPGQPIGYPAKYSAVMGVGALANDGTLWNSSQTGPEVTVVAPGAGILSTWDTPTERNTYKQQSGTSMATPFVSGLAGLILSIAPELSPDEVEWVIRDTAFDLGDPGVDSQYGAGRVSAAAAVHTAYALAATSCRADFSKDGIRDGADIIAFVEAFLASDPIADLAIPFGVFDSRDIERFLDLYINECDGQ
ncbi:MAG: subtilisin family serine protease [Phycisphaerales bacterium]|jgi:subtilisin family serine protease